MNLLAPEPWPEVTSAVRAAKGRVVAAVAYIGDDAPDVLPLKRGDLLVCDATKIAVRSGTTSPSALEAYRRKGVELHSVPGLHAKVVVLARRAYVGSSNASRSSRDTKLEAVLSTVDTTTVRDARKFVLSLTSEATRLDGAEIADLATVAPARPRSTSSRRPTAPAVPPARVDSIYVESAIYARYSATQRATASDLRRGARATANRLGAGVALEPHLVEGRRNANGMNEGRWIAFIDDADNVYPPGQIVARREVARGDFVMLWIATPPWDGPPVTVDAVEAVMRRHGKRKPYTCRLYKDPALVRALWRLWQLKP